MARTAKSRVKKMMDSPTVRTVKKTIANTMEQVMHGDSNGSMAMPQTGKAGSSRSRAGAQRARARPRRSGG
jgi:hypothetical protein